ncbi:glycosyltransferase family 2 protein [Thiocapsa sp.]|uniref:glycosyltransferase family 2 protein n=1 Tax=Thiocapsa sp. TaxID=2024551 RepID=UPI0035934AC9
MIRLGIVVPCYNEEQVIRETTRRLRTLLDRLISAGKVCDDSCIYYVDDGSHDDTWLLIETMAHENPRLGGIKLSRNRGHQNALLAGLFTVPGDAVVSIDADLQDDVDTIEVMVDECINGADIVYGVRDDRRKDTYFKRQTAHAFYRVIRLLGIDVIYNHADFRLMTRRTLDALQDYREVNLFLRGIVPLIGFSSVKVYYTRASRAAGESKYPLRRMLSLAWEGITSFSIIPLRIVTALGAVIFALTLLMSFYVIIIRLFTEKALPGWASTVLPIYLLGGVQILAIGILGEYLGKVYREVKARPRYAIEKRINV